MSRLGSTAEEWAGSAGPGFGFSTLPSVCASVSTLTVSIFPLFSCPSCHGKAEECISLCRALLSALTWLLRCATFYAEKVKDPLEQAAAENQLKMCLERLEKVLSSTKNRALIHIAKLEETCTSLSCMLALGRCHWHLSLPPARLLPHCPCGSKPIHLPALLLEPSPPWLRATLCPLPCVLPLEEEQN